MGGASDSISIRKGKREQVLRGSRPAQAGRFPGVRSSSKRDDDDPCMAEEEAVGENCPSECWDCILPIEDSGRCKVEDGAECLPIRDCLENPCVSCKEKLDALHECDAKHHPDWWCGSIICKSDNRCFTNLHHPDPIGAMPICPGKPDDQYCNGTGDCKKTNFCDCEVGKALCETGINPCKKYAQSE